MAERRMFAKTIVLSDEFLDMPTSTRCLYFTLGMFADDDGFVNNPKSIIRQIGASVDDMNILIAKKFIIMYEDGVIVIKHWRINNLLRADRHQQTKYVEKLNELYIDEKGAYTQNVENAVKRIGEKKVELIEVDKELKPTDFAREKRKEARKRSDLPYSFDYKIRQAFHLKTCPICGCKMDMNNFMLKPTIQHNVPISLGGEHEIDNISVICKSCNTSIQNRHITEKLNNEEVKRIWEQICLVANPDTEYSIDKDSIDKNSIVENNIVSNINKEPTPFDTFIKKYNITCDNYSTQLGEMDFALLDKAYAESKWLQDNFVCLSQVCKNYNKIIGGAFKDFIKPKKAKSFGFSGQRKIDDLDTQFLVVDPDNVEV
jgi:hypothetical protein